VKSERPVFFTTPSPAEVDAGASVDFGIGRSLSSIRGILRTDAGDGVPGVVVHVAGSDRQVTARTGDDGAFVAERLPAGIYDVTIEPGSVPAGYPVDALAPQRVDVKDDAPGRATFVLQPYRSVSGRAQIFNRQSGQYVALSGATVELQPLGRKLVTDANGHYTFRDLPPGDYTVVASYDKQEHVAAVTLPAGPAFMKGIDVAIVPGGKTVPASSPREERAERARAVSIVARKERAVSTEPRDSKPAAVSGFFTIQVAASANLRHARAMVSELQDGGHAAYLVEASDEGSARHEVRVGHYRTLAEADKSAGNLEKTLGWRLRVMMDAAGQSSTN
jgi:cell division septation protein DedD